MVEEFKAQSFSMLTQFKDFLIEKVGVVELALDEVYDI